MMNALLQRLDRWVAKHGEPIEVIQRVGGTTLTKKIHGVVRTTTVDPLVEGLTQNVASIIVSPTGLGGVVPRPRDAVRYRGAQKAVEVVNAIIDRGECVRLELRVKG